MWGILLDDLYVEFKEDNSVLEAKKKLYLHKIVKANVFLVFCGIDSQVLVSTERKNTFYCQLVVIVHK